MRGLAEIGHHFNELGIKLNSAKKAGATDEIAKGRYEQLSGRFKDASTIRRHRGWWLVAEPAYAAAYDNARSDGQTKKQAHKHARRQAESAVVEEFQAEVKTTKGVRIAFNAWHDPAPLKLQNKK